MTIALGILATDGLVIAADTEESYGTIKRKQTKIWANLAAREVNGETSLRCWVMSGAGSAAQIDAMFQNFRDIIRDGSKLSDVEIEAQCHSALAEFHAKYVMPYATDRPEFDLVIGAQLPHPRLLYTSGNLLQDVHGNYIALGTGATIAYPLLDRLYQPGLGIRAAVLLAAYVMHHTKESVMYCGKDTEILGFAGDRTFEVPRDQVKLLESAISEYSSTAEPMLLFRAAGMDEDEDRAKAGKARARLKRLVGTLKLGLRPS